jgi:hypothetical protein
LETGDFNFRKPLMDRKARVALLIDADHLPASKIAGEGKLAVRVRDKSLSRPARN